MSAAPRLAEQEIKTEIGRIFARERRAQVTALYGSGEPANFNLDGQEWRVIPTRSELELRAQMPLPNAQENLCFLVDWTEDLLPLDLRCRLAGGNVFRISRGARLAGLFGARQTESTLLQTGLATVLLAGEITDLKKVTGLRLTHQDAVRHFLHAFAGWPLSEALTPSNLARWCFNNPAGVALVQRAEENDSWRKMLTELREAVKTSAGPNEGAQPIAACVWAAWEQDNVPRMIEIAMLVAAHMRRRNPMAQGLLQGRLTQLAPGFGPALLEAAEQGADLEGFLRDFFEHSDSAVVEPLLSSADTLIPEPGFADTRAESNWLPAGHATLEQRLADALEALVKTPTRELLTGTVEAANALKSHYLDERRRSPEHRETRTMGLRLAAWLVQRAQQPPPGPGTPFQPAIDLATDFAQEGGYVDWCRGRLRGTLPFDERLNANLHAVLRAADALRKQDDQRFAEGLIAWHEAGRPAAQVLPIDRVTRDLASEMLSDNAHRKVLVLVMDGMSWATAVQLLHRLEGEQWAPILWRPKGHQAKRHLPPVLAALPTLTQVSRAALIAGKYNPKDGNKSTHNDSKRWAANSALIRANDDAALPELVLRSKLMSGEKIHEEVKKAIESDARVVGVVVNAIDEDLKGSSQSYCDYKTKGLKPLNGLLSAASGAERVVLLCSDHGHVLGDAMSTSNAASSNTEGGARWRTIQVDDAIQPYELELPADAWCPKGSGRIAATWNEKVTHSHPHYGEHGGLSLAEVVAPAIMIAPEWLFRVGTQPDQMLATTPFPHPAWWDLEVAVPRAKAKPPVPVRQSLPLFPEMEPARSTQAPTQPVEAALVVQLRDSKVFKANTSGLDTTDIEKTLKCLSVLLDAGGQLGDKEFARRCETRVHRVGGLVARMGTVLNIDGYPMVEHDRAGHQVTLHKERLMTQYWIGE